MQEKVKQWLLKNQRETINYQHSRKATEQKDQFVYFSGLVTIGDNSETDFQVGIGCTSQTFGKLSMVWRSIEITRKTDIRIYEMIIQHIFLYESECWIMR